MIEAAAVVADVDDEAFLAVARRVNLAFELFELVPEHSRNVNVAESAVGELLDVLAIEDDRPPSSASSGGLLVGDRFEFGGSWLPAISSRG